jgi:hypothetical protein
VLDTTVVSELLRAVPNPLVVSWMDAQPSSDLYITSITVAELFYGTARMPDGARKSDNIAAMRALIDHDFAGRILPFDVAATRDFSDLVTGRERAGRPTGMADALIAATAVAAGASLIASRNPKNFADVGVALVDPWTWAD